MNNLSVTAMRQSLFSSKGTAAPSPTVHTAPVQRFSREPTNEPINRAEVLPSNGLAGLIKRASPGRTQPTEPVQPTVVQPYKKLEIIPRISLSNGDLDPTAFQARTANIEKIEQSSSKRRQLTVRIEMEKFEQLDQLAKSTGQTYQDIQSKALDAYLFTTNNMKRFN
jgi:hypothetical protein